MPRADPSGQREPRSPPGWFVDQANVDDADARERFDAEWPDCWSVAADLLDWSAPYDRVLARTDDGLRWFEGGTLNPCYNCVDRHVEDGRKNATAIRWEGRTGETRTITYLDLQREVNEAAAALRELGVAAGDVVTLYMPVIPELPIAMLACARLGALHNVVYSGFSADELTARVERTASRYLVTCDGYYRRGSAVNQKTKADNARLSVDHDVEMVVVTRFDDTYLSDELHDYHDIVERQAGAEVAPVERAAGDPLFLLYTSGTTGRPGRVTHSTGGYLSYVAWTTHAVLDVEPEDTYWCAADIGWITGHSYIVYGPLALGTTTLLYEGAPGQPDRDKLWRLVDRYAVDVFYTSPTAVRAFMKWGADEPRSHDLSSLRLLGSVGEPIDPRAWHWYREHVGGGECPVVDTWWQTETGGIVVSTLPGADEMKPGSAGRPLPGIDVTVVDEAGETVPPGEPGVLSVTRPWPGMPLSVADGADGDDWEYVTGDRAVRDEDGYVTFLGRTKDTLGAGEGTVGAPTVERAIVDVDGVVEAAVVESDERDEVVTVVSTGADVSGDGDLEDRVRRRAAAALGTPGASVSVVLAPELPKTHSGKVMRRLLAAIVDGASYGDTSALRNPETVGEIEVVVGTGREESS